MKNTVLILALLTAPLSVFCQGKDLAGVDPSGQTVSFWYQHSGANDKAMQKLIEEFNAANEWKMTVKGEFQGQYNDIYNKMVASIAAGNPPELVVAYQNQAAAYAVSDALTDLNPYVRDPKWGLGKDIDDFFAGFINQDVNAQFGGKRLGFPPNRSIEIMYYNASLLSSMGIKTPPKTWDQFAEACRKAMDSAKGTYGYTLDTFDASHVFAFVVSRGGDIARPDGKGYTLSTPQMKATMVFMKKLFDNGWAKRIANADDYQSEFGNGNALFTIVSTSRMGRIDKAVKAGKSGAFDWSVAPVPQQSASGKPALDLYGASVSVPKTTPQKQLAAWLFIKWFSEPKQQAAWTQVSGYFPVRRSAETLLGEYMGKDPHFTAAWGVLKAANLKAEPPFAGYDLVRDAINAAYSKILDGADVDKTLSALNVQANKIYKDSAP